MRSGRTGLKRPTRRREGAQKDKAPSLSQGPAASLYAVRQEGRKNQPHPQHYQPRNTSGVNRVTLTPLNITRT
jgi:hypothetical protein